MSFTFGRKSQYEYLPHIDLICGFTLFKQIYELKEGPRGCRMCYPQYKERGAGAGTDSNPTYFTARVSL